MVLYSLLIVVFRKSSFDFNIDWQRFGAVFLDFNYTISSSLWASTWDRSKNFYFGDKKVNIENFDILCRMYGERTCSVDAQNVVILQANVTNLPAYYYYLEYKRGGDTCKYLIVASVKIIGFGRCPPWCRR